MTPAPSTKHQKISGRLFLSLANHLLRAEAGQLFAAPTDVLLSEWDVVQPDLLFVRAARSAIVTERNVQGPPDLVIEIISETSRKTDETVKRKLYERHGVPEYWIVDPELETVAVYRMGATGYIRAAELSREADQALATPLLPDLTLKLSDIFT